MINRERLAKMYDSGKSMADIAGALEVSPHAIAYWMTRYGIPRRTRSAATYAKRNPHGDPYKIKSNFTTDELILLGLGLGLWWGEGSKKHPTAVRLGNTDPKLIKTFVRFLIAICGVKKRKIRFGLQIFSDMNPEMAKRYWMQELGFPESHFMPKIVVTPARSIGTYREKSKQGVLTVYVQNVRLRNEIIVLLNKHAGVAQSAEQHNGNV